MEWGVLEGFLEVQGEGDIVVVEELEEGFVGEEGGCEGELVVGFGADKEAFAERFLRVF